jgi:hypothetical protein
MSLTWTQLTCLLEGIKQVNEIRNKEFEKNKNDSKNKSVNNKKDGKPQINDFMSMLTLPGFNLSKDAKEKLMKLMKNKINKKDIDNG